MLFGTWGAVSPINRVPIAAGSSDAWKKYHTVGLSSYIINICFIDNCILTLVTSVGQTVTMWSFRSRGICVPSGPCALAVVRLLNRGRIRPPANKTFRKCAQVFPTEAAKQNICDIMLTFSHSTVRCKKRSCLGSGTPWAQGPANWQDIQ